ncbi:MAG: hypothetical protein FH758_04045 [Firmicutes bacterium]|nr:hypothetical protein [Bacillota bacterium]
MVKRTTSTITSKGQTTVPREVRYTLELNEGDKINYILHDKGFIITKAVEGDICPHCNGTGRCKNIKEVDDP